MIATLAISQNWQNKSFAMDIIAKLFFIGHSKEGSWVFRRCYDPTQGNCVKDHT
jgi:hypothetical protein